MVNFIQTRAGVGRSVLKAEVPPCASCHGPDAKGADAFPRLAGQLHNYMFGKLTNWDNAGCEVVHRQTIHFKKDNVS